VIPDSELPRVVEAIPALRRPPAQLLEAFRRAAFLQRIPAGRNVFVEGDQVGAIPLLVSGRVRVYQVGETGREVTLYRFRPGESCVLTANAILTGQAFPAVATVEEDAEAVMIPAAMFREWVAREDLWRRFFVDLVAQRLASVMSVVDEVAFQRLDVRIARLLWQRAGAGSSVRITHQEIASELGSAREAVSRVLEDLAGRELISSRRGQISIRNPEALERLAASVT
jgi:CRP/FNR family transcriptional regulator, anaerobic regulatory protein